MRVRLEVKKDHSHIEKIQKNNIDVHLNILFNQLFIKTWVGESYYLGDFNNYLMVIIMVQLLLFRNDSQIQDQTLNIKNKVLLSVQITIYLIGDGGTINLENKWGLVVNYFVDDFRTLNFKLKNIEVLMRMVSDSIITTNSMKGISYSNLLLKIEKNKTENNKNDNNDKIIKNETNKQKY